MHTRRFDVRTFLLMLGAALIGLLWANYNRMLAPTLPTAESLRPHVWAIFALPFGLFCGWLFARPREGWLALFVCFCIYFFSTFIAARYESCAVLTGRFNLGLCFTGTAEAQDAANTSQHALYFQAILVIQMIAAAVMALQRAFNRSTMPVQVPQAAHSEFNIQNSDL